MNKQLQYIKVLADNQMCDIPEGSETEFITQHYWGYSRLSDHKTYEYEVRHPRWQAYPVKDYHIQVDFGLVYGQDFALLNDLSPVSVMLAEGSEISVENKRLL